MGGVIITETCNISDTVQETTNITSRNIRKSHTRFQLVPKSMPLDDLQRPKRTLAEKSFYGANQKKICYQRQNVGHWFYVVSRNIYTDRRHLIIKFYVMILKFWVLPLSIERLVLKDVKNQHRRRKVANRPTSATPWKKSIKRRLDYDAFILLNAVFSYGIVFTARCTSALMHKLRGLQIWQVHSQGPSEHKPMKNFGEKGAWAYPGTAKIFSVPTYELPSLYAHS